MQLGLFGDLEPAAGAKACPLPTLQEIEEARYQEWLQSLPAKDRQRFLRAVANTAAQRKESS